MKLYKWRKKRGTGSHSFRFNGKWIDAWPGDVVIAPIDAMGSFNEGYDCLAEIVGGEEKPITERPVLELEVREQAALKAPTGLVVEHRGFGRYYVINPDNPDKPLNDKAMKKEDAEKFMAYLSEDA